MNLQPYINRETFYLISFFVTLIFAFYYYWQTIRVNKDIYWYVYDGEDKRFDAGGFCKKIFIQLLIIFFAFFTFVNVIYFCVKGSWVTDNSFQSTRSFVIIGAVAYLFDIFEKSVNIHYDHKKTKIKTGIQQPVEKTKED